MNVAAPGLRERRLHALGVEPLRLRRQKTTPATLAPRPVQAGGTGATPASMPAAVPIRRLALLPDSAELGDAALRTLYAALTEAVGKAGLERVRPCDVANDADAAVMVFGAAEPPGGVPAVRVLCADPLSVLHADRERKRHLWAWMQALGRGGRV